MVRGVGIDYEWEGSKVKFLIERMSAMEKEF